MKNSWKDGNTRPSYLSAEKHVAHQEATVRTSPWDNGLVQNWERSTSRLYKCHPAYLTLCRVHPVKCQVGWITNRNQDCWEKYQQPQMCRWYHPNVESKEELKNLLIKVKENEKAGLKLSIQKTKIVASGPITSWQIDGGKNGNSERLYFLVLQNHCGQWLQPWN